MQENPLKKGQSIALNIYDLTPFFSLKKEAIYISTSEEIRRGSTF
jgi:hypothetical protein